MNYQKHYDSLMNSRMLLKLLGGSQKAARGYQIKYKIDMS